MLQLHYYLLHVFVNWTIFMARWLGVMAKPQLINNHVLSWTIDAVPDTASAAAAKFFYMLPDFFAKLLFSF